MNYLAEITETQLQIIYKVMIKRIAKGYSAEQLSYLLGRPRNYVSKVEFFAHDCYHVSELSKIAKALEEDDYTSFLPATIKDDRIKIHMEKNLCGDTYTYTCATFSEEHKRKVRFVLEEYVGLRVFLGYSGVLDYDMLIVLDTVEVMIRDQYFGKQRSPLDVFLSIKRFLKFSINPYCLQLVLDSYCETHCNSKLKRVYKGNYFFYILDEGAPDSCPENNSGSMPF